MRVAQFDGFWQVTLLARLFPISVYLVADDDGHLAPGHGEVLADPAKPLAAAIARAVAATTSAGARAQ